MKTLIFALLLAPSVAFAQSVILESLMRQNSKTNNNQQNIALPSQPILPMQPSLEINALMNSLNQNNQAQSLLAIDELARRRSNGSIEMYYLNKMLIQSEINRNILFGNR